MFKKTLLTAAAALAITAGATSISTPDANAGVKWNITFGHGYNGYYGGHYNNYGPACYWKKKYVKISFWRHGHKRHKWVWKSYKVCY